MPGHIESAAAHDIFLQMKLAQEEKKAASIKSSNSIKTSTESIKSVAASQKTKVEGSPLVFETATPQFFQSRFLMFNFGKSPATQPSPSPAPSNAASALPDL
ncbi:hypothetical protein HDU99_005653, partial [Rhizoclosmatium hyalinum]